MISKHFLIADAVLRAIKADTVSTNVISSDKWRTQKRFWHRGQSWLEGGTVVPLRRTIQPHENDNVLVTMPVLIGVVKPADGSVALTEAIANSFMMLCERLEMIFAYQGQRKMPATLTALSNAGSGVDDFIVEKVSCMPGDVYMDGPFENNYETYGLVVAVEIIMKKQDFSSLGA